MITARKIFRQLVHPSIKGGDGGGSVRLSIEGIAPAPLTAEPDDAELAAAALLEAMAAGKNERMKKSKNEKAAPKGSKEYYEQLSEKIKAAHEQERRAAMRFVAYCEKTLSPLPRQGESRAKAREAGANNTSEERLSPFTGEREEGLRSLETGLFKWQDAVEREGGELLRRWQHCLATVTVLQMQAVERGEIQNSKVPAETAPGNPTNSPIPKPANSRQGNPANSRPQNPDNNEP